MSRVRWAEQAALLAAVLLCLRRAANARLGWPSSWSWWESVTVAGAATCESPAAAAQAHVELKVSASERLGGWAAQIRFVSQHLADRRVQAAFPTTAASPSGGRPGGRAPDGRTVTVN